MSDNIVPDPANGSTIPPTHPPTSLFLTPNAFQSVNAAPIPLPTPPIDPPPQISSRPKRYVRPRATTDHEKITRAQERKVANRTAAKQSRERQKEAMEQAQVENDRLKEENAQLLTRLANLESRMQAIETRPPQLSPAKGMTYLPARPMMEPQCPIPSPSVTLLDPSRFRMQGGLEMRMVVYIIQILMHSFALSVAFRVPLRELLMNYRCFQRPRLVSMMGKRLGRSRWMASLGKATLDRHDLSGAIRGGTRRGRVKSLGNGRLGKPIHSATKSVRSIAKDVLRVVKKGGRKACIRLIIKKKSWKRTDK